VEPYLVFLIIAVGLFVLGCLWEWLQSTEAYAGSDSGGECLWVLSGIAVICAAGTNLVIFAVLTAVLALILAITIVRTIVRTIRV